MNIQYIWHTGYKHDSQKTLHTTCAIYNNAYRVYRIYCTCSTHTQYRQYVHQLECQHYIHTTLYKHGVRYTHDIQTWSTSHAPYTQTMCNTCHTCNLRCIHNMFNIYTKDMTAPICNIWVYTTCYVSYIVYHTSYGKCHTTCRRLYAPYYILRNTMYIVFRTASYLRRAVRTARRSGSAGCRSVGLAVCRSVGSPAGEGWAGRAAPERPQIGTKTKTQRL